jgi:hypothetical protein
MARALFEIGNPAPHSSTNVATVGIAATAVAFHFTDRVHRRGRRSSHLPTRETAPTTLPAAAPP